MGNYILKGNRNLSLVFRKFLRLTNKNILFLVINFPQSNVSAAKLVRQKRRNLIRGLSTVSFFMQWSKSDKFIRQI